MGLQIHHDPREDGQRLKGPKMYADSECECWFRGHQGWISGQHPKHITTSQTIQCILHREHNGRYNKRVQSMVRAPLTARATLLWALFWTKPTATAPAAML